MKKGTITFVVLALGGGILLYWCGGVCGGLLKLPDQQPPVRQEPAKQVSWQDEWQAICKLPSGDERDRRIREWFNNSLPADRREWELDHWQQGTDEFVATTGIADKDERDRRIEQWTRKWPLHVIRMQLYLEGKIK